MTRPPQSTVHIDFLPESVQKYPLDYTVVAVDVIRATTTAITALQVGRRCFPVGSLDQAKRVSVELDQPLLVGELNGEMPADFNITNSPAALAGRSDNERPMVLLSSSGTRLIAAASGHRDTFVACLRNHSAQARWLVPLESPVVIIGAGTKGQFRQEDQMCCAWIAAYLINNGWVPGSSSTAQLVDRWRDAPADGFLVSPSVDYLARSNQLDDLRFILDHVDDVDDVFAMDGNELKRRSV